MVRNNASQGHYKPEWMEFNAGSLRIYGVPTMIDLDSIYNITIRGTNGYQSVNDSFYFNLSDATPVINPKIISL